MKIIKTNASLDQTILIVHNLKDIENIKTIKEKISELKNYFDLNNEELSQEIFRKENDEVDLTIWNQKIDGKQLKVKHLIMASEKSSAGKAYNSIAIQYIQSSIGGMTPDTLDIEEKFLSFIESEIANYFIIEEKEEKKQEENAKEEKKQRIKFQICSKYPSLNKEIDQTEKFRMYSLKDKNISFKPFINPSFLMKIKFLSIVQCGL